MFNQLEEAKAFDELRLLFTDYDILNIGKDSLVTKMNEFRLSQKKISQKRLELSPERLTVLARYYYYHHKDLQNLSENERKEAVGEKLTGWITDFENAMRKVLEEIEAGPVSMLTPNFDLPPFDNQSSLEAILTDAIYAGPLTDFANDNYPAADGLQTFRLDGAENQPLNDAKTETDTIQFWRAQLWMLACMESGLKKGSALKNQYSDRVRMVFTLMIWYAAKYGEYRKACVEIGMEPQTSEILMLPAEAIYMKERVFPNDKKAFQRMLEDYKNILFYDVSRSLLGFRFADPKSLTIPEELELPDLSVLDDGVRLFSAKPAFYGITLDDLKKLLPDMLTENNGYVRFSGEELRKKIHDALLKQAKPEQSVRLARAQTFAFLLLDAGAGQKEIPVQPVRRQTFGGDRKKAEEMLKAEREFCREASRNQKSH